VPLVGTFDFFLQCPGLKSPERKLGAIAPQGRQFESLVDASEKAAKRPSDDSRADSAGEVSIYAKRHLRKHRRLLPLQEGEFRAAEQP